MSTSEGTRREGVSGIFPWATPAVVDDIPMTESVGPTAIPYGAWPSPISAADAPKAHLQISYPIVIGDNVWWQETRPDEGGRVTVVHFGPVGKARAVLVAPAVARTPVNGYGAAVIRS